EQLENRGYRPTANWVEKQVRMCLVAHMEGILNSIESSLNGGEAELRRFAFPSRAWERGSNGEAFA
ncbi:MAG: hypothetical protein WCK15_17460, partial [Pirellula sp.]